MTTRIWLFRHGESTANAGAATADPAGIPLTDRGAEQARRIARSIGAAPSMIITSPYLRTQQTAAPTLARFPEARRAVWPIHEFTYLSPIICGHSSPEDRRPMVEAFWGRADPAYVHGEGAESFAALIDRVADMQARLEALSGGPVAVFGHGQFMHAWLWLQLVGSVAGAGAAMAAFHRFVAAVPMPNGARIECVLDGGRVRFGPPEVDHLGEPI